MRGHGGTMQRIRYVVLVAALLAVSHRAQAGPSAVWELRATSGPPSRQQAAMVYDGARHKVVLYGGAGGGNYYSDTWEWDGTSWSLASATGPGGRYDPELAYDVDRDRTVLFGSCDVSCNDTWEWDGTSWAQRATTGPSPRYSYTLDYDEARHRTVMFGGRDGPTLVYTGETWTWDGTTWTLVSSAGPARGAHASTYDVARQRLIIAGGLTANNMLYDTWLWDGSAWTLATNANPGYIHGRVLAYDTARARSVLFFGEETWEWDGAVWQRMALTGPSKRDGQAVVFDRSRRRVVLFGGTDGYAFYGDTWEYHVRGDACTTPSSCDTGYCVDGVCCEVASCGVCEACNTPAATGICAPIPSQADPDTCAGNRSCDSAGVCKTVLGAPCTADAECLSGHCSDGVCCDSACDLTCQACSAALTVSGTSGACDYAAAGIDPHGDCVDDGAPSCGRDGTCDGAGACRKYLAGTDCGLSVCTGNALTSFACDGAGSCLASPQDCSPNRCSGGACSAGCSSDADCALDGFCNAGVCAKKLANGQACVDASSCLSKICVDGVCCNAPCLGQCEACDVLGREGACLPVAGAPHGARPACPSGPIGEPCAAPRCDGSERLSCAGFADSTTACRAASCSDGIWVPEATCDGQGGCPLAQPSKCEPYVCQGDHCGSAPCVSDDDCAAKFRCASAPDAALRECVARSELTCDGDHTLLRGDTPQQNCAPYRCDPTGTCKSSCASSSDCVAGVVCSADGLCSLPVTASAAEGGCGCRTSNGGDSSPRAPALWLSASLLALVRRARSSRRRWRARRERTKPFLALGLVLLAACSSEPLDGSSSRAPPEIVAAQPNSRAAHVVETIVDLARTDRRIGAVLASARGGFQADGGAATSTGWHASGSRRFDEMGARVPQHADEPRDVGASGGFERFRLRVTPEGARPSELALVDGKAVYVDAYASADLIVIATTSRVEELVLLRDWRAPREFVWRVELPPGIAEIHSDGAGGLVFADRKREGVVRVPRPWAVDARGRRYEATLEWRAGRLRIALDDTDLVYPTLLDPAFEQAIWELAAETGPPARSGHGLAFDSARGKTVLFGGSGRTDTWEWDGTSWTEPSSTGPNGSCGLSLAYDSARARTVLAGVTGSSAFQTWEWDGTSWTERATSGPSVRCRQAVAYDAARRRTLFTGGCPSSGNCPTSDTWQWDGATWTEPLATSGWPIRQWHGLAYDSDRQRTVLFGGLGGSSTTTLGDTWEWDGTNWTNPANTGPTPRMYLAMTYDAARRRTILFGGAGNFTSGGDSETWEWDGTAWTLMSVTGPPDRILHALAYDSARRRTVLFGGEGGSFTSLLGDTWEYHTHGGACSDGSTCDTGFCVDGVCCETACAPCRTCDSAASPGICVPVINGDDPDSCAGDRTCDAAGDCKARLGAPCASGSNCFSGYCASGVCCDGACDLECEACSAAAKGTGADGNCGYAATGTDPRGDCPDDGLASCGRTGVCNGAGACERYPDGSVCGAPSCFGSTPASFHCVGSLCLPSAAIDCAPYACRAGTCASTCTNDADCALEAWCQSGTCLPDLDDGLACDRSALCKSGNCADGVCCDTACAGQCEACAEPGGVGTCVPIVGEPRAGRPACPTATPDNPCAAASCDGVARDQCAERPGPSVECAAARCQDGVAHHAATCDGLGACADTPAILCEPYVCQVDGCGSAPCHGDADCAPAFRCALPVGGAENDCLPRQTVCDGNHTLLAPDGTTMDCTPLRCDPDGTCKASCASSNDCVAGFACHASGRCTAAQASTSPDSAAGCGCRIDARRDRTPLALWLVMLGALAATARQRYRARADQR